MGLPRDLHVVIDKKRSISNFYHAIGRGSPQVRLLSCYFHAVVNFNSSAPFQ